jgi:hypothetical protein
MYILITMEIIRINKLNYVLGDYVLNNASLYCKGCRSSRDIIKKKEIEEKFFIYARQEDGEWKKTDGLSAKFDKVLLRKIFIDANIPELNELVDDDTHNINVIEKAPEIINLEDNEKFHDDNGNIIEIETCGTREYDKIYFKVKDVSAGFEMNELHRTIIDKDSKYVIDIDYKFFTRSVGISSSSKTSKKITIVKELFLTYEGILRVLFVSRNNKTTKFIDWVTKTLFTAQMGTKQQKEELTSTILGVTPKAIREVFNKSAKSTPCVYLFTLGLVKDLRESMNIDIKYKDDDIVGKYGFSKELDRRNNEHEKKYGAIKGCDLRLKLYTLIDPQYISEGESDIRNCIDAFNLKLIYEKEDELIIITKKIMPHIENVYKMIGDKYSGHTQDLKNQLKEWIDKNEKQELIHKNEKQELIHINEKQKLMTQLEIQAKQLEIVTLKSEHETLQQRYKCDLSKKQDIKNVKNVNIEYDVENDTHITIDKKIANDNEKNNDKDANDVYKEFANKHIINNDNGHILWADLKSKFLKWHHENKDTQVPLILATKLYFEKYIFKENEKTIKMNKKSYRGWRRWSFC